MVTVLYVKKIIDVSDNTIHADGLVNFFEKWVKKELNASKKMAITWDVSKMPEQFWKLEQTLVVRLHLKALKQLYQHHEN